MEVLEWRRHCFHKLVFTCSLWLVLGGSVSVVDVNATRRFGGGGRRARMTYRKQQTAVQVQNGSKCSTQAWTSIPETRPLVRHLQLAVQCTVQTSLSLETHQTCTQAIV